MVKKELLKLEDYRRHFEQFGLLLSLCFFAACSSNELKRKTWFADFISIGSYSSPRLADLNQDGILDIVIGAGLEELQECEHAVLALNGANGELLWTASASAQMVGSATFLDVNQDGTTDVIIGGRNAELVALDGSTGEELWRYQKQSEVINTSGYIRFNFYNTQIIPDQNDDGQQDLLVVNGGNLRVPARMTQYRYPGVLAILDSKNGQIIAADLMPDEKESYMSPIVHDFNGDGHLSVIFGSGGETIAGNLYRTSLEDLRNGDISGAEILLEGSDHGFIAPPVLVDINGDLVKDIVVNNHGGASYALNGKDRTTLWKTVIPDTEISSSSAIGFFNDDDIPDVFNCYLMGQWPQNQGAVLVMLDGATGTIERKDTLGCTGMSSPVAFDRDRDGKDEILISINNLDCKKRYPDYKKAIHHLALVDFDRPEINALTPYRYAKNMGSTPWLGDMDGDQKLDLVFCEMVNTTLFLKFFGMRINRVALGIPLEQVPSWGAYMGNHYNGVFDKRKKTGAQ